MSALWHKHWHFKTTDKVIPVCQHYDTDIDTSRQQMEFSLCVSIMTQTMTFQDNRWSYNCVSALWHRLWHFKKTDKVIIVCQHYDTYIDTARKQMKLSLCVNIMTQILTLQDNIKLSLCVSIVKQTLTLQDKRWSYPCVSALWHRHWHFKTTYKIITMCQHCDTNIDTSRQQIKLSLCVSIVTQTLTLQDNR